MSHSSPPFARVKPVLARPLSLVLAHWATAALLLTAVITVLLRECVEGDAVRKALLALHQQVGLLVLVVIVLRVLMRLRIGSLASLGDQPAWQRWAAAAVHGLLYCAALALPLLGWAASNARGETLSWLSITLPHWVAERDLDLADELIERHQAVAWALLALVLAHAGAALWHHFVVRDDVLIQMWPWRRGGREPASNKLEETR